jgi:hypothetical protein
MALSGEDRKDVARAFGKKAASAVSSATKDYSAERQIQNYGEQHPQFHSKRMKEYRKADKASAKARAMETVLGQRARVGSKKHSNLTAQKKHFDSFDSREL